MFQEAKTGRKWSAIGFAVLVISTIMAITLSLIDGILKGGVRYEIASLGIYDQYKIDTIATWVYDFRYLAEQGTLVGAILFLGSKLLETRTTLTIGFAKLDDKNLSIKGPDENNIVWFGHRYATAVEAQAVADTLAERVKQSKTD